MVSITGVQFASAYKSRLEVDLDDTRLNVINRDDFIRNRQATGCAKDFIDLKELGVDIRKLDKAQ